ncbi:MAG: rhodanese-related sulfurtransferase [Myxococcota bacterium]|jgi:rhodanese-related sulfurtransferase
MKRGRESVRFLNLVEDARLRIHEILVEEVIRRQSRGERLQVIDVREDREWLQSHITGARHLSKGTIERDIELYYRDLDEEVILYCEGGLRSALAADNLGKMGYTRIRSLSGGFRAWKAGGGSIGL